MPSMTRASSALGPITAIFRTGRPPDVVAAPPTPTLIGSAPPVFFEEHLPNDTRRPSNKESQRGPQSSSNWPAAHEPRGRACGEVNEPKTIVCVVLVGGGGGEEEEAPLRAGG